MIDAAKDMNLMSSRGHVAMQIGERTIVTAQLEEYFAESALHDLPYYTTNSFAAGEGD